MMGATISNGWPALPQHHHIISWHELFVLLASGRWSVLFSSVIQVLLIGRIDSRCPKALQASICQLHLFQWLAEMCCKAFLLGPSHQLTK